MSEGARTGNQTALPPLPAEFSSCVARWPAPARRYFDTIRRIVWNVAVRAEIGTLDESLKWGQPSWLPQRKRVGSTLRCYWHPARADTISLYLNCNTTLAETMKTLYPTSFDYEGRRGLHLSLHAPLPKDAIDHCAFLTLTYHRKSA